jgi:hypothetical protein
MTTRREFIAGCSLLATGVALQPATLLSASGFNPGPAFELPGLAAFGREVGTTFHVLRTGQPTVELFLTAAQALPTSTARPAVRDGAAGEHQFSLLFSGPRELALTQDTYTFAHASLGPLVMFIVPVLPQEERHQYYEAIFNRHPGPIV